MEIVAFFTPWLLSHIREISFFSLTKPDGTIVTEHGQKENLLLESYKQRLGIYEFSNIHYDLSSLLAEHNLGFLDSEFSQTEIEAVIKSLPNDHAPRPDGFNGLFIKKSWDIIKDDFTRLFRDFYHRNTDLKSVNSSVITLIPKKNNPETVDDYRPISLLN